MTAISGIHPKNFLNIFAQTIMAYNLPDGVLITELEDDLHYISSDDEVWERELEKGDAKHDEDL